MAESLIKAKQADLQELEYLRGMATRPNVREFLAMYIQTLSKDIAAEMMTVKSEEPKITEIIQEEEEEKKVDRSESPNKDESKPPPPAPPDTPPPPRSVKLTPNPEAGPHPPKHP